MPYTIPCFLYYTSHKKYLWTFKGKTKFLHISPVSYSINTNHSYSVLAGIYKFDKNLFIKGGTSTNRLDQTINSSFFRNIFSDFGIGLIYKIEDIVVDVNSYSYGTGGLVFAIGLSVYY